MEETTQPKISPGQGKAHLHFCKSLVKSSGEARVRGKAGQWHIWGLQWKVFAEAGSRWGSPCPFQKEMVAQLTSGHYNKHRKNKIIKQEKEEKKDRDLQPRWEPGLQQLHSLPQGIVRNWKTLPNHLPGAAEQFSSISKQFELCWLWKRRARPEGLQAERAPLLSKG